MHENGDIARMISGGTLLAPMLAVSDIPFRRICRAYGAVLSMTEMVSARGIARARNDAFRHAVTDPTEGPVSIQLAVSRPADAAAAVQALLPLGPALFDINAGCPNERVCDAGAGAGLLDTPQVLEDIVRSAVRASHVPVSVKMRAHGVTAGSTIVTLARAAENGGAAFLTVHARPRFAPYEQPADWRWIAEARAAVRIPVVGNGDVFSSADATRMREETGCDAVMIARGALGTPWIFRDIAAGRRCDITAHAPADAELHALVTGHMQALRREFGDIRAIPRMRKHALWYARRHRRVEQFRNALFARDCAIAVSERVDRFFTDERDVLDPGDPEAARIESLFRRRVLYWTTEPIALEG
jgi:tRNA-dihydrouridine synthase B